jgi:AcrR family transcriptional regulator
MNAAAPLTKKQRQGQQSRGLILNATERLMATNGYAATSISDIRNACGLPPSSIYWHFGSKEGVLAAVMERGADRFFAAIPMWDDADVDAEQILTVTAGLLAAHPDFLRLFYMLCLERGTDPAVAQVVRRVRSTAIERFRDAISHLVAPDTPSAKAQRVVSELTAFAVAQSDGVFFAAHLESETTDVGRMYRRLFQAVAALVPILLKEHRA